MPGRKPGVTKAIPETSIPLDPGAIRRIIEKQEFDFRTASIREMNKLVNCIEAELGIRFLRMEFGIPGLPAPPIAIEAEVEALRRGEVAHVYSPFEGIPELKEEASRFVHLFLDLDVPPACCVPTVGAMQGCFASLAVASRRHPDRKTVLFLEPGFPVNKLQTRLLGLKTAQIDFYDHRAEKLIQAVETRAKKGDLCAVIWSSPNNPSWIVLKETELEGLGAICDRFDLLAIEDLAYFGMDTRQDYSIPGRPPFQPTVLRYTRRGICIISSSKIFSYAGQRIALSILSPGLLENDNHNLVERFGTSNTLHAFVHGVLYPNTACVPETPQYGLLALLKAANRGDRSLFRAGKEYARRAAIMKKLFLGNGFHLVYDNDLGEPLADGFYFTIAYPGFDLGVDLQLRLLHYGISAITLETAGSCRKEGLRACVSLVSDDQFPILEQRLQQFRQDHPR
ncbi:MAG: pyridoxal phosphate-dependent aminotransferase [Acidobacteria bacterium]|nr:pyridoxal phosphate-dependent aminotransferase [Acidobacteriota bacterium]